MIEKMLKTYVAVRNGDHDKLLTKLGNLGVVHLKPIDPSQAVAEEKILSQLEHIHRALQILEATEPQGVAPDIDPVEAANEVFYIQRQHAEYESRLASLHRQIEQIHVWGDTRLEQLAALKEAGLDVKVALLNAEDIAKVKADCIEVIVDEEDVQQLVMAVKRDGEVEFPEEAHVLALPDRDAPSIREEAHQIDAEIKKDRQRLHELAHLEDKIRGQELIYRQKASFSKARRGALENSDLFAVQGWVPAHQGETLAEQLNADGLNAAVQCFEPLEEEDPPTLVVYPKWAQPIKALFQVLGTTPGYREYDLTPFFMLAMPIFTAMLVGDAGYGLIFMLAGLFSYKKLKKVAGAPAPQLIIIFGLATFIWGVITANYFGVGPADVRGLSEGLAGVMQSLGLLWREDAETGRNLVMQVSFIIGCIHLMLAHLRRLVAFWPNQLALAEIGWCMFIFSMFTLVWLMFFGPLIPTNITVGLLVAGWVIIALFCHPVKNPVKRIAIGVLSNLMSISNAFGDMMSYIRLMAVGLASYYIASAFNGLAGGVAGSMAGAGIIFAILILVAAHALNIILCLIAIFAHGVRLNMLEFSNNAGVQWSGVPFSPFRNICSET